jgi:hypothetical protein
MTLVNSEVQFRIHNLELRIQIKQKVSDQCCGVLTFGCGQYCGTGGVEPERFTRARDEIFVTTPVPC